MNAKKEQKKFFFALAIFIKRTNNFRKTKFTESACVKITFVDS